MYLNTPFRPMIGVLPTHDGFAMVCERGFREWFGLNVSPLVLCRSGLNGHVLSFHMLPEMMVGLVDMFGSGP